MSNFSEIYKKTDPEYKKYCEDTLKITREEFNNKIAEVMIDSETSVMRMIELGHFINDLWHHLKGDN